MGTIKLLMKKIDFKTDKILGSLKIEVKNCLSFFLS